MQLPFIMHWVLKFSTYYRYVLLNVFTLKSPNIIANIYFIKSIKSLVIGFLFPLICYQVLSCHFQQIEEKQKEPNFEEVKWNYDIWFDFLSKLLLSNVFFVSVCYSVIYTRDMNCISFLNSTLAHWLTTDLPPQTKRKRSYLKKRGKQIRQRVIMI